MGLTMRNLKILLIFLLFSHSVWATMFQPLSLRRQLLESSGVVQGEVQHIESELDDNGKIITRVTLRADRWIGLNFEQEEVSVFFPGGKVGDQARLIEGVPDLSLGENVVLFVKRGEHRDWVSNLGLGKYSIKRVGKEQIMVNQVFPTEPSMGQIRLDKFYALAKEVKSQKFQYRFKEKYELHDEQVQIQTKISNGRSVASVENTESSKSGIDPFWLVIVLGSLGVMVGVIRNRTS